MRIWYRTKVFLRVHAPPLGRVVGIPNLSVDQRVTDAGRRVGQAELTIVRVQPMLQGSEQDYRGVVDAGHLGKSLPSPCGVLAHQQIDRAA